jgi:hypothetical protein
MPAVPGASYAVTGTVTAFTSTNTQAGTDTGSATVTVDNLSPDNVTGAGATPGDTQATVSWTNPGSDFSNVLVLRNTATIGDVPTEGSSPAVDSTIGTSVVRYIANGTSFIDTGLTNGIPYFYRIFAKDPNGNYADTGVEVSATAAPFSCPIGSDIFNDGFETGNLSAWSGSSAETGDSVTASTDQAKSGTYSLKGDVDNVSLAQAMVWKDIAGQTTIHAKVELFVPTGFATTDNVTVMQFLTGWSNILSLSINTDMTLYLWNTIAGEAYGFQATSTLTTNAWHTFEMRATISDTVGEARFWLDGNLEITATNKNLGTNPVDKFSTGYYWGNPKTEANTVYNDDVVLCATPTTAVTSAVAEISPNDVITSSTANSFSYDIRYRGLSP